MATPRVLLVEDDASVRRFVAMALDESDIELVQCESVGAAFDCLASQPPFALALMDLSLADGSALRLVEWLAMSGRCRVAVFSAGVTGDIRARLEQAGVWRILEKPVALAQMRACVAESTAQPQVVAPAAPAGEGDAAQRFFGGNAQLHAAYAASCRLQFAEDVRTGDQACERGDLGALRRLGHSLKTVLTLLGHEQHAATARMLDQCAGAGDGAQAVRFWYALRPALMAG